MTLDELRAELRNRLDDEVEDYLWSDATLDGYLNDADRQSIIRQRLIVDTLADACCKITLVAGQQIYALHPSVLAVRSARVLGSNCEPLSIRTAKWMWRRIGDWDATSCRSDPTALVPDLQNGAIAIYPAPAAAGVLKLAVWRTRLDDELMESGADEPQTPPHQHLDLIDWAEHRAYGKKDSETHDQPRADRALAIFEAKFGRMPSAVEMRLWGVSRPQGVGAEFL